MLRVIECLEDWVTQTDNRRIAELEEKQENRLLDNIYVSMGQYKEKGLQETQEEAFLETREILRLEIERS